MQLLLLPLLMVGLFSCSSFDPAVTPTHQTILDRPLPAFPLVRFAVLSDCHVYDPALGTEGPAFESYLASDRKLLRQSLEIFQKAVDELAASPVQFVLLCGDLTKDGEKSSHRLVAAGLKKLRDSGKQVFIVPGNHDVQNPAAMAYGPGGKARTENVSAADFTALYQDCGYNQALSRAPDTLSYSALPAPGLRLLALDSTRYQENPQEGRPVTSGRISALTLGWAKDQLAEARMQKEAVLVMLHHGLLEHFDGQKQEAPMFLVDHNEELADLLRRYGVQLVFTGHFHAMDITQRQTPWGKIDDVETGSLATDPCAYRILEFIEGNTVQLKTQRIRSIPSIPVGFSEFARKETLMGIESVTVEMMGRLGCSPEDARLAAPQIGRAFLAHFEGDEQAPETILDTRGMGWWAQFILSTKRKALEGLWRDLPPADNNLVLKLEN